MGSFKYKWEDLQNLVLLTFNNTTAADVKKEALPEYDAKFGVVDGLLKGLNVKVDQGVSDNEITDPPLLAMGVSTTDNGSGPDPRRPSNPGGAKARRNCTGITCGTLQSLKLACLFWALIPTVFSEHANTSVSFSPIVELYSTNGLYEGPHLSQLGSSSNRFAAIWSYRTVSSSMNGDVYVQVFEKAGDSMQKVGSPSLLASSSNSEHRPSVASLGTSRAFVAYEKSFNVYGVVIGSDGSKIGSEQQVASAYTGGDFKQFPKVASLGSNKVLVVYQLVYDGVFAQVLDENGNKVRTEFQVHTSALNSQIGPVCSSLGSTHAIVVWRSNHDGNAAGMYGVYAQIIDSSGSTVGSEFRVDDGTTDSNGGTSVSPIGSNRAIITWSALVTGEDRQYNYRALYAQIITDQGQKIGSVFQLNSKAHRTISAQCAAPLGFNRAIIVFIGSLSYTGSSSTRTYALVVDSEGNKLGSEFLVSDNSHSQSEMMMGSRSPAVSTFKDSNSFTVAWLAESNGVLDKHYMRMYTILSGGFDCQIIPQPGFYCPEHKSTTDILICPSGFFCTGGNTVDQPQECPAGNFCPQGSSSPQACRASVGYYCPAGAQSNSTICPIGYYCLGGSHVPGSCSAKTGYYCPIGSFHPSGILCPTYNFCDGNTSSPVPCSRMINCIPCNEFPNGTSGSMLNREEQNLRDIGASNPNFDAVTWGLFKNCSEVLYPEHECDWMSLCAFCSNTCSVSTNCQTYFIKSAQSVCAPGFCLWTSSVLPSNANIVGKVFIDELSNEWFGDQGECRWECKRGFKTVLSIDHGGVVASCIPQRTIAEFMDSNMSHCTLQTSWSDIRSGSRYKTGGLGKLMTTSVYEVWVCDKLDPCLSSAGVSAGDYMCYVYNEATHVFEPLTLNSRVKFLKTT